jgi:hypothetical protein
VNARGTLETAKDTGERAEPEIEARRIRGAPNIIALPTRQQR